MCQAEYQEPLFLERMLEIKSELQALLILIEFQ